MGRFDTIKTTIDANIKENGNQEITGQKMNSILTEMVNVTDAELTELESKTGEYSEAEEYIRVYTDANGKFLMGIKADGSFEFAKGVPMPIKKELETKANAEVGKSLIDEVFAHSINHIEDAEKLDVVLDSSGRIIEYTTPTKKVINLDVEINGKMTSKSDKIIPTKQVFTIVGSSDNVNRYYVDCRHIILKKGHHYRIEFSSDNFQIIENIGSIIFFSALNPAEKNIDGKTIHINSNNMPSNIEDYCPQCDLFIYYWSSLKTGCYLDVTITEICDLTTHGIVKEYASDISAIRQFINAKKAENLFAGDIVTPAKYRLAVASGFDIDVNTGNMYIGGGVSTAAKEDDWSSAAESETCLIIHNLLTKETEVKPVISIGEAIGEYIVTGICNEFIVPMITGEDEVSCLLRSVSTSEGKFECVVRKYHPSTKLFDNELLICDIAVGDKTFTFQSNTDLFYLRDETKCEYFEFTNSGAFYFSMGPIKVNDDFYQVFDIGYYSHILAKSSDMIHWQFVADIPIGAPSEEVDICYGNGRIYATSRGNKGRFPNQEYQGYSTVLYYDLKTKTWCQPVVLTGYYVERPTIFAYEDEIYCIQGRGEKVGQNGYRMPRLEKHCLVFDRDLNLRKDVDLTSHINNLHPLIRAYGNTAFAVTSTDIRCISYYQDGNDRSELTVSRLNMDIWKL